MTVAGLSLGIAIVAMLWSGDALRTYAPNAPHMRVSIGPVFALWFRLVVGLRRADRPWRSLAWLAGSGAAAIVETILLTVMFVAGFVLGLLSLPLFFWVFAALVTISIWSIQAFAGWGSLDAPRDAWPSEEQPRPWNAGDYALVAVGVLLDITMFAGALRGVAP